MVVILKRSTNPKKKYMAIFTNPKKMVHFGAKGYSDYTIHGDYERMKRYITRHRARENWTFKGRHTPGFWSRWLLWSDPNLKKAIKITEEKLGEKIRYA